MPTQDELIGITAASAALIGLVLYVNTGSKKLHEAVKDEHQLAMEDTLHYDAENLRRDSDDLDKHYQSMMQYFAEHGSGAATILQLQDRVDERMKERLMSTYKALVTGLTDFQQKIGLFKEMADYHKYDVENEMQEWNNLIQKINSNLSVWNAGAHYVLQQQNIDVVDRKQTFVDGRKNFVHHHRHENLHQHKTENITSPARAPI